MALIRHLVIALVTLTASCGDSEVVDGYDALERHMSSNRVGEDADQWIEMKNSLGEWERVGLIFGYVGDHDECRKAISGLQATNEAREYRCVPAN